MELLTLGGVGCGWAGQQAIKAAQASSLVNVVAVSDLDEPRRSRVASEEGVPRQYGPYQDLLADDQVQAVLLAVNPPARYPMVLDAFAAGKHVLVQKPHAVRAVHTSWNSQQRPSALAPRCNSATSCATFLTTANCASQYKKAASASRITPAFSSNSIRARRPTALKAGPMCMVTRAVP